MGLLFTAPGLLAQVAVILSVESPATIDRAPDQPVDVIFMNSSTLLSSGTSVAVAMRVESDGPRITGVDFVTGTPWEGKAQQRDLTPRTSDSFSIMVTRSPGAGIVILGRASDRLAGRITFDASGIAPGDYALTFDSVTYATSLGTGSPRELNDGVLTVVPEPGSMVTATAAGLVLLALLRRRG